MHNCCRCFQSNVTGVSSVAGFSSVAGVSSVAGASNVAGVSSVASEGSETSQNLVRDFEIPKFLARFQISRISF